MANNIQFKIGTLYDGEGFTRARNDIDTVNKNVKKGAEAVTHLQGALGEMDASAAKAFGAMTNLASAILSFNVTAVATQVAVLAINKYLGEMKEAAEAAKTKADELHASVKKAFDESITTRISSINSEVKKIGDDFERITKQANQFAAALEGVRNAEANGGIINLQVEKLNALLEAHGDEQRANIEAAYNLKIAIQKSADVETTWQSKIDAAHQAVVDSENRMSNIDEQIAKIGEERRSLEQTMLSAKSSGDKNWLDIQKQVTDLWKQEEKLEQKKLDVESQTDVLRQEEKKVKQEALNAQGQATIEIRNAELAEKKLTESKHERQLKEDAAKEAAELKAEADRRDAIEIESAADIQKRLNESANELQKAEETFARKLQEYNSSDLIINTLRDYANNGGKGGLLPVDIQKGISLQTADTKVDDAIRTGAVSTVKEADMLQRRVMRETRNKISTNQTQQLNEAKKYKRLQEMNPKTLCSADMDFMEKYEKIQEAAKQRKQQLDNMKEKVEQQKEDIKKSREALDQINKKLDDLGLK